MEIDNKLENLVVKDSEAYNIMPDMSTPPFIIEISSASEPIVTINKDGSHTFHKPDMIDEAARILWQAVSMRFSIMNNEEYDIISKTELESLKKDAFELQCLHSGGVDNWESYHISLEKGGFYDEEIE